MARKRRPLVVNGETVELDAPGLNAFQQRGEFYLYWRASPAARKRGYVPRDVRLYFDINTAVGRLELERRCQVLTTEMLAWLGDPKGHKKPVYDGTVGALINCYLSDQSSPYAGLRQSSIERSASAALIT